MKHFLIGTLCAIMCKAFFPYPTAHFNKHELDTVTISIFDGNNDNNDLVNYNVEEDKFFNYLFYSLLWENEETDEDESLDEVTQKESHPFEFVKASLSDSFDNGQYVATIPLFVLFHSWKCFLF